MTPLQRARALCGLAMPLIAFQAPAQDEPTMRIMPALEADRPATPTRNVPFAVEARARGAGRSDGPQRAQDAVSSRAGDNGSPDSAGGPTTAEEDLADAAAERLASAREAAESAREAVGRAHAPFEPPDRVLERPDVTLPEGSGMSAAAGVG